MTFNFMDFIPDYVTNGKDAKSTPVAITVAYNMCSHPGMANKLVT
jgi:hypothetical protein